MKDQQGPIQEQHNSREGGARIVRFGNYDLVRRIDVGGMGEVYLAHQRTAFGREVAVKIIRSDLVHDMLARRRFLREAEVNSHLKHEHILPLFEFGEEQGRLFLVTPYIEGGTLAKRLQSGALPLSEIYQLFTALVQAIAYIHKRGVIHRDLKPSNILLDREADTDQVYVRLIDFGIASIQGLLASEPLTTADNEMGTLAYLAPERLSGIAAPSNDIYSLGIILYEMLTGHLPTPTKVARFPRSLEYLIHHCIAPDPEARFISADELLRTFEQAYAELTSGGPRVTAPVPVVHAQPVPPPVPVAIDIHRPDGVDMSMGDVTGVQNVGEREQATSVSRRRVTSQPVAPTPQLRRMAPDDGTENRVLERQAQALPQREPSPGFGSEDYGAPTTYIAPQTRMKRAATVLPGAPDPSTGRRKRSKRSFVGIISVFTVIILLVLAGVFFLTFQSVIFTTATITLSPRMQTISNTFTLNAKSGLQSADIKSLSIPMNTLSPLSQNETKTGPTSGRPFLCLFNCPKAVSSDDVNNLVAKERQELIAQLTKTIKAKLQAQNATQVGDPQFEDVSSGFSYQPSVGTTSDTVTVTMTEQVTIKYINNADAEKMANDLLQPQLTPHYKMLQVKTGVPVVMGIGGNGIATVKVAAAALERYQLQNSEVQAIVSAIKGKKRDAANAYIINLSDIDTNSIRISVSSGDTLPSDSKQITVTIVIPTTLPPVPVPTVSAPLTPTATPAR